MTGSELETVLERIKRRSGFRYPPDALVQFGVLHQEVTWPRRVYAVVTEACLAGTVPNSSVPVGCHEWTFFGAATYRMLIGMNGWPPLPARH